MENFIAHTDEIRKEILDSISCKNLDDLFRQIPIQFSDFKMKSPLSELEAQRKIKALARKNEINYSSFLGGGVYNKFIPACVNYITQRFEFLSNYDIEINWHGYCKCFII